MHAKFKTKIINTRNKKKSQVNEILQVKVKVKSQKLLNTAKMRYIIWKMRNFKLNKINNALCSQKIKKKKKMFKNCTKVFTQQYSNLKTVCQKRNPV